MVPHRFLSIPLMTAIAVVSTSPISAFAASTEVPQEARDELKACHQTVAAKYGIDTSTPLSRREALSNLSDEQKAASKQEMKICKDTVAAKYNLTLPDPSQKRASHRQNHRLGGFFGNKLRNLSEEQRSAMMAEIKAIVQKYAPQN